jgi:hypothetical protein
VANKSIGRVIHWDIVVVLGVIGFIFLTVGRKFLTVLSPAAKKIVERSASCTLNVGVARSARTAHEKQVDKKRKHGFSHGATPVELSRLSQL